MTNQPSSLEPIATEATSSIIARRLRGAIADGSIAPGQQLVEVDLAETFRVSRGPVREAVQRLSQEGLVSVIPNRGAFVRQLGVSDISDIYIARLGCEGTAARILARHRPAAAIDRLRMLASAMVEALGQDDWTQAMVHDRMFHEALVEASGSPRLESLFQTLVVETVLCLSALETRYPDKSTLGHEHIAIVEAIEAGDAEAAYLAVEEHMREGAERLSRPVD